MYRLVEAMHLYPNTAQIAQPDLFRLASVNIEQSEIDNDIIVEKVYSADNTVDQISAGDSSEIFHSSLKHFQS